MSPESATIKPVKPVTVEDAMKPWREKLRERGLEPGSSAAVPERSVETPEEAAQRKAAVTSRYSPPEMYLHASLGDLDDNQHAVALQGWLHSGALHLVLAGAVGTGKTHAAYAVGNQARAVPLWVESWNVGDLMDALRPGAEAVRATDDRVRRCRVLILDDLTAKATEWEAERLTLILDARVREQLQTVVTTNITRTQIMETWGARFMDRLSHRLLACTFTGESRRGGDWT